MLKIGLTGGIGSGKSTVAKVFEQLGVPVFYADLEAKKMLFDSEVKSSLKKLFGEGIFDGRGEIHRSSLAQLVFNDKEGLQKLNNEIHPRIHHHFKVWCEFQAQSNHPYIIKEAAIIFEAGVHKELDKVICVAAPLQQRIQRVIKRDEVELEHVEVRMNNQWPQEQIVAASDFVINNNDDAMVLQEIIDLHSRFLQTSKS